MQKTIKLFEDFGSEPEDITYERESGYLYELLDTVTDLVQAVKSGGTVIEEDLIYLIGVNRAYYRFLTGKELFDNVADLLYRKTMDYNSDLVDKPEFRLDDARVHYFPFGHKSYLQMLSTKVQRLESLFNAKTETQFEGKQDSLVDIASYLAFYYSFIQDENAAALEYIEVEGVTADDALDPPGILGELLHGYGAT